MTFALQLGISRDFRAFKSAVTLKLREALGNINRDLDFRAFKSAVTLKPGPSDR